MEPDAIDQNLAALNVALAKLLTDGNGIAHVNRSADNYIYPGGLGSHFMTAEDQVFGVHIYGDQSGSVAGDVFVPSGFKVKYIGGKDGTVEAYDPKTGILIHFYHVAGVNSQRELERNMKTKNSAGSRLIGQTGGKNGETPGYMHTCIRVYNGYAGYESHRLASKRGVPPENSFYGDLRRLIK